MVASLAPRVTVATWVEPLENAIDPITGWGTNVTWMSMEPVAATIWTGVARLSDFPFAVTVNVTVQVPIVLEVNCVDGAAGLANVPHPLGEALQANDIESPSASIAAAVSV